LIINILSTIFGVPSAGREKRISAKTPAAAGRFPTAAGA